MRRVLLTRLRIGSFRFVGILILLLTICASGVEFSSEMEQLATSIYVKPKATKKIRPIYPEAAQRALSEGWVLLHFMVGTDGKPRDIEVADHAGNDHFRFAAVGALRRWRFQPATFDVQHVEAGFRQKVIFSLSPPSTSVSNIFSSRYRRLQKLISSGDQETASELLDRTRSETRNLFEFSWLGIAEYNYQKLWGTTPEQLEAVTNAIAYEQSSKYLPQELFDSALLNKFLLELELNYIRSAIATYEDIVEQATFSESSLDQLADYVAKTNQLKDEQRAFSVSLKVPRDGYLSYRLLWNRFALNSQEGEISKLRVTCDRKGVELEYTNEMIYDSEGDAGACSVSLESKPGITVTLYQI